MKLTYRLIGKITGIMKRPPEIRALIIDDEQRATNILRLLIEQNFPDIHHVFTANTAAAGVALIKEIQPDLLFLDIRMPKMNGFELLDKVKDHSFEVIFTTAHDQYAIQAIRVSAIDYLLKPIQIEDLTAAIQRFLDQLQPDTNWQNRYKNLVHNLEQKENTRLHRLAIPGQEGTIFLEIADILRCEASNNYTFIFLKDGNKYLASKTLKEYEEALKEYNFLRVHKSHLVNTNQVKKVDGEQLVLSDGSRVEMSRRRKPFVLLQLKQ